MANKSLDLKAVRLSDIKENKEEKINSISKRDIAIIGITGRFPSAATVDDFWENLRQGRDCVKEFPEYRRADADRILTGRGLGPEEIQYYEGAYFDEVDKFDYGFFRLSPKEAALMDPNQRIFLEETWKAVEAAGYGGDRLTGSRTGIYVGFSSDFGESYANLIRECEPTATDLALPGNIKSIIAGRISYILDLKGPSITVDTACSSALVAVHLACQGIRNGECELAIAGGIKVNLLPAKGLEEGLGIEASEGRAKTFDDTSDGTGFGEGAAVVVLKPLKKALENNDHIHAIIKGSAVNQDGASVGITAPNSAAQEDVIIRAWKDAGINPETISFIEAHGTGTKLGDPIEIEGISMAFEKYTRRKQFCAIGSVKSNMGHPDHAAGILGLVKAVMAIEHREIPPTLHFKKPNRKIDFTGSPVYVNDRLVKWKEEAYPMRCGISSFGLSGTNCHLILEEFIKENRTLEDKQSREENRQQVIALSAKSETALMDLVKNYCSFLNSEAGIQADLEDICHTADTCRGHYNYRLALIIDSKPELQEGLNELVNKGLGSKPAKDVFFGRHKIVTSTQQKRTDFDVTSKDIRELTQAAASCIKELQSERSQAGLEQLCSIYVHGGQVCWEELYKGGARKKVLLPVYPFERKRCWVSEPGPKQSHLAKQTPLAEKKEILHPLLESRIIESMDADIYETVYSVDKHWVLKEHRVAGSCVVPGTTYLELAREIGNQYYRGAAIELKNVLFLSPLIVNGDEHRTVQTIVRNKVDFIEFEVVSREAESKNWIKHAEGVIYKNIENTRPSEYALSEIIKTLGEVKIIDYRNIETDGVDGGPRFKNMKKIYIGTNEALACLELPEAYAGDLKNYLLHPALMDSAVNMANHSIGNGLYLPLSFKKIKIWGATPAVIYSYLRKRSVDVENSETAAFDVTILDEAGKVLVEIEGFTIKKVHRAELKKLAGGRNSIYKIGWTRKAISEIKSHSDGGVNLIFKDLHRFSGEFSGELVNLNKRVIQVELGDHFRKISDEAYMVGSSQEDYDKLIRAVKSSAISRIYHFSSMNYDKEITEINDLKAGLNKGVLSVFYLTRAMLNNGKNENTEIYLISDLVNEVTLGEKCINPNAAALFGLGRVISEEYPKFKVRCIDIDENTSAQDILSESEANEHFYLAAYRDGIRFVEEFREAETAELTGNEVKIRENGVYLVTGGLGGIGLEICKYLSQKNKVKLCLINRSKLPEVEKWDEILGKAEDKKLCRSIAGIKAIEASGSEAIVYSADISNIEKIDYVLRDIRQRFQKIDGIIHCAGIAGDGFLVGKEAPVFECVLSPKIYGTWILDNLTMDDQLDFFVLFSSISSIFGAQGQGDYTAANAYLDSYAACRNKTGRRTLSINWPQWKETGMAVDFGVADNGLFRGITNYAAIQVLDELLGSPVSRIIPAELNYDIIASSARVLPMAVSEDIDKAMARVREKQPAGREPKISESSRRGVALSGTGSGNGTDIERKLAEAWGNVLGVREIDVSDNFYDLGGDSVRATRLLKELEKDFEGVIDISDIFTYPTISDMSNYIKSKSERKSTSVHRTVHEYENVHETVHETGSGTDIDAILGRMARGEISAVEADKLLGLGEKK